MEKQKRKKPSGSINYVPTPEEIAEECAKIRASWTPGVLLKRERESKKQKSVVPVPVRRRPL